MLAARIKPPTLLVKHVTYPYADAAVGMRLYFPLFGMFFLTSRKRKVAIFKNRLLHTTLVMEVSLW